jgi:hypothetical protein
MNTGLFLSVCLPLHKFVDNHYASIFKECVYWYTNLRTTITHQFLLEWTFTLLKMFAPFTLHDGPGQRSRYSDSLRTELCRERIPVEARFSAPVQNCPGAQPAFYTMGTGLLPERKADRP